MRQDMGRQAVAIARIEQAMMVIPRHDEDIATIKDEQAETRGAVQLLKWMFPTTIAAASAAVAVAGYAFR